MSKVCENCNKEILDENTSCPYCGFEFNKEEEINSTPVSNEPYNAKPKKTLNIKGIVIAIVAIFVGTIIGQVIGGLFGGATNQLFGWGSNKEYSKGIISGSTYESEFMELKFECPAGYQLSSTVTTDQEEALLGWDDNEAFQEAKEVTLSELEVSGNADGSNLNILVAKGSIYADLSDYEEYLSEMLAEMVGDSFSVELQSTREDTLAGETYKVFTLVSSMYGFEFKQEQYIRNIGDYCVIITFSGDDMENLKAGFSALD